MKIKEIVDSKKTPNIKKSIKGIAGKNKFNGNFNTEVFLIEITKNKRRKKAKEEKAKQ